MKRNALGLARVIDAVQSADILVGIPCCQNEQTVTVVIRAALEGLKQAAPGATALVLVVDSGAFDGTGDVVRNLNIREPGVTLHYHAAAPSFRHSVPYHGNEGKEIALKTILETSQTLGAHACVLLSGDLKSISPEWVVRLLEPLLQQGYEYVAPVYQRHRYDGTLSQTTLVPLMHTLYGKALRQPLTGEAAFSGTVAAELLRDRFWTSESLRSAVDLWRATAAVAGNYRVCQTVLGTLVRAQNSGPVDVSDILVQLAGAAFTMMDLYYDVWKRSTPAENPVFGDFHEAGAAPVSVNLDAMIERFRLGVREFMKIWSGFLPREIQTFLQKAALQPSEKFQVPDEVWAEIVCSFALAHHRKMMNQQHLVQTLTPLYLGKTASFIQESRNLGPEEFEAAVGRICRAFGDMKYFLKVNWPA